MPAAWQVPLWMGYFEGVHLHTFFRDGTSSMTKTCENTKILCGKICKNTEMFYGIISSNATFMLPNIKILIDSRKIYNNFLLQDIYVFCNH